MHDTLSYMSKNPIYRKYHHGDLTFGLVYAFDEHFILPLSHDEVVHGKGSLFGKMPGDEWQKAANLRLYLAFMYAHPGKKLLFMGAELGQVREWNHDWELDWGLLQEPLHGGIQRLLRDLNRVYSEQPALYELDFEHAGFEWIDYTDAEQGVIAFRRRGADAADVIAVCNMTPVVRHGYRLGVDGAGRYEELVNTDAEVYGGSNVGNQGRVEAEQVGAHGRPWSLPLVLPPLATLYLQRID
jgi:1,4-alpha-glucan branching enzyme